MVPGTLRLKRDAGEAIIRVSSLFFHLLRVMLVMAGHESRRRGGLRRASPGKCFAGGRAS